MEKHETLRLETEIVGSLPIVNHFIERIGIEKLLSKYVLTANNQKLDPVTCIGILLRNIIIERDPLYGLKDWAERYRPDLLKTNRARMEFLNDDRVGRALEYLFDADRATLLTEMVVKTILEFNIDTSQLHNDSTPIFAKGIDSIIDGNSGHPIEM